MAPAARRRRVDVNMTMLFLSRVDQRARAYRSRGDGSGLGRGHRRSRRPPDGDDDRDHQQPGRAGAQRDAQRQVLGARPGCRTTRSGSEVRKCTQTPSRAHSTTNGGQRRRAVGVVAPAAVGDEEGEQRERGRPAHPGQRRGVQPAVVHVARRRSVASRKSPAAVPFCSDSGITSSRSTAIAKLALPGGMIPSAIGLSFAPPMPVAVDVEQVVEQAHDQLGDEHGRRR